jgi:hypothetical protein
MKRDQVFYAVLFLVACLLWASVSSARAYDQRLILTDHLRKERVPAPFRHRRGRGVLSTQPQRGAHGLL